MLRTYDAVVVPMAQFQALAQRRCGLTDVCVSTLLLFYRASQSMSCLRPGILNNFPPRLPVWVAQLRSSHLGRYEDLFHSGHEGATKGLEEKM